MDNEKKNRLKLRSYFVSNATPTEQQFKDLIDASLNQAEDGIVKIQDGPIALQSIGTELDALQLYQKFDDPQAKWKLALQANGAAGLSFAEAKSGISRLFIDEQSGKIGMGTSIPKAKLHISEDIGSPANFDKASLLFEHGDAGGQSSIVFKSKSNPDSDFGYISYKDNQGANEQGLLTIGVENDGDDHIALMPSGNVGVGIRMPAGRLHIYEPIGTAPTPAKGSLVLEHGNAGGKSSIVFKNAANLNSDFAYISYLDNQGANEQSLLTIGVGDDRDDHIALMSSGGVGIGTTQPWSKLHIAASGNSVETNGLLIYNENASQDQDAVMLLKCQGSNGGSPYMTMDVHGVAAWTFGVDNRDGQSLKWADDYGKMNTTTRMTLNRDGNLGIGTTDPKGRLHLFEKNGTPAQLDKGTLVLEHGDKGGTSSIVFRSAKDGGSDMGYISFQDARVEGDENNLLIIGVKNDVNDNIALLTEGGVGIGTTEPTARLQVMAKGNVPWQNGILVYNNSTTADQDAVLYLTTEGPNSGDPYILLGVGGQTSWSFGVDNSDNRALKWSNSYGKLGEATKMTLQTDGKLGIGTPVPQGKLHLYEENATPLTARTGTLILEHRNGGESSILFPSTSNNNSDYAYIRYEDNRTPGAVENGRFSIGIENDNTDLLSLSSSGGIELVSKSQETWIELSGKLRIVNGTQGKDKVLVSDNVGNATFKMPSVRRDMRPYDRPSYCWDGTSKKDSAYDSPDAMLGTIGNGFFTREYYDNGDPAMWNGKNMFTFQSISAEGLDELNPPVKAVKLTLPATPGVHNALVLSFIDADRWSHVTVWLCNAAGTPVERLMQSSNNTYMIPEHRLGEHNDANLASTFVVGPRNGNKETGYHSWHTFPITESQLASNINNGKLQFAIATVYGNTNGEVLYCSGFALVPNPYGFVQHTGRSLHMGMNGMGFKEIEWHSNWNDDGLIYILAKNTKTINVKIVDPSKDVIVTFLEHANMWHGGTLNIRVGNDNTMFTLSSAIWCCSSALYQNRRYLAPMSIIIPKEIVQAQVTTIKGTKNLLQLKCTNPSAVAAFHFRGVNTEIGF